MTVTDISQSSRLEFIKINNKFINLQYVLSVEINDSECSAIIKFIGGTTPALFTGELDTATMAKLASFLNDRVNIELIFEDNVSDADIKKKKVKAFYGV